MSRAVMSTSPTWPRLGRLAEHALWSALRLTGRLSKSYGPESRFAQQTLASLREKIAAGETAHLLGITPGGHNTGVSLVEVSGAGGIRLLSNHEEERFCGEKHCQRFPARALETLQRELAERCLTIDDLDAVLLGWNYQRWAGSIAACFVSELPVSLRLLEREASPAMRPVSAFYAMTTPRRLKNVLGARARVPVIHLRHHDNHAAFSYATSPFASDDAPVGVLVIDGTGDDGAISWYLAQGGSLRLHYRNDLLMDSLGLMYGALSSAVGGWPITHSEGRFMGAAAWGNMNRLTNPYYAPLREILHFGPAGRIALNRRLASWHRTGIGRPFTKRLTEILGEPVPPERMWNPDAVLNVDDIDHAPITRERVDKAAAVQMVFEDGLLHIVGHLVRTTGVDRLVLSGGTALNCVANMRVVEHFNEEWYAHELDRPDQRLHIWIPPTPNDEGVAAGAAFNFAMQAAAPVSPRSGRLQHAFYCGMAPTQHEIAAALAEASDVGSVELGNVTDPRERARIADLIAWIVSQNGIVGLYQGVAETGPRALGHRSILANPANPDTLKLLNSRVKYREAIRPLAPMATLAAAQKYFRLSPGASDDEFNAYNYMILTAPARPIALEHIPAVVHHDGTGRVQIVREKTDPFSYTYLEAMGRHIGAEVSVNTSLNVGAPIAQTPADAIATLMRSGGMHGLLMIAEEGTASLAWHHVDTDWKDKGATLGRWLDQHARADVESAVATSSATVVSPL